MNHDDGQEHSPKITWWAGFGLGVITIAIMAAFNWLNHHQ